MKAQEDSPQFWVAIDDRLNFCRKVRGYRRELSAAERQRAASLKAVAFDGLVKAIEAGLPKSRTSLWADADLGEGVHLRARAMSLNSGMIIPRPVCEPAVLGEAYDAIKSASLLGAKAVIAPVNYHPFRDVDLRQRQLERLRLITARCEESGLTLAVALIPPADTEPEPGTPPEVHHAEMRTMYLVESMRELQDMGVNAGIWLAEPPLDPRSAATFAAQAHVDDRTNVSTLFAVCPRPKPAYARVRPGKKDRVTATLAARTAGVDGIIVGPHAFSGHLAKIDRSPDGRESAVEGIAAYLSNLWAAYHKAGLASGVR